MGFTNASLAGGHVRIMLPDFSGLLPQSGNRDDLCSQEQGSDKPFSDSRNFQQFKTRRDRTAFEQYCPSKPQPSDTVESEPDYTDLFYKLWLAQPSWSPIVLTHSGWKTVKGNGKKKVPLTFSSVESNYRRGHIVGKRFGNFTNYLLIDIDFNSPFHPRNQGYQAILATMERLGLCRYLIIRSSTSGGLHLYFPLPEPVKATQLALAAHNALSADGIHIAGGICELFPNKKSFNAEHHGHRLPLQDGSFLLDNDFCPISNHKADFVIRWNTAAAHQDEAKLQQALAGHAVFTPLPAAVTAPHTLPPIAWTQYGKSNDTMRELVNYGDRYVGHKTVDDLAAWVKAVAPLLPGYQQFASPKSKRDIEYGTWPRRWAKSHFKKAWVYKTGGSNHNAEVAANAKRRIFEALDLVCVSVDIAATTLYNIISQLSKVWHGVGFGPATFKKHEAEIMAYVKQTGMVGLSRTQSEDVNSFPSESAALENVEPEKEAKSFSPRLSTLRCVLSAYSNAFDDIHTSKSEGGKGGGEIAKQTAEAPDELAITNTNLTEAPHTPIKATQESQKQGKKPSSEEKGLTIGQRVRIAMPGGSLDGIATRVIAQALNVLGQPVYQLEHQRQGQAVSLPAECLQVVEASEQAPPPREAVIRAAAAQLLQVLGKACPFVGPGLWTVRRSEVSAKDWGQLLRLVGKE